MKKNKFFKGVSLALAMSMLLVGCGGSKSPSTGKEDPKKQTSDNVKFNFPETVTNEGTPVENQTLKVGILSNNPLRGMFNPIFWMQDTDMSVMGNTMAGAFPVDETYKLKQDDEDAPVKLHIDRENKKIIYTIHEGLKWSNGEPVTSDDIVATYELMGNPEYKENIRYNEVYEIIEGMKEYHEGKEKTITGIKKIDDRVVEMSLLEVRPSILWGDGLVYEVLNKKQIDKITDFAKFAEQELNTKPLSYGPYYLDKVVNGESVLAKANPYYYKKDKVKLKSIEFKVVPPAQASLAIKNGDVDMLNINPNIYETVKDYANGTVLGSPSLYLAYIGFKLGKMNPETGKVEVNPDSKAADLRVRQAFAYAIDMDTINEKIYKGLSVTPTGSGWLPPVRTTLFNKDAKGIKQDLEKAKKLLDEAGLKDVDGDGLREDKNGNKLTFNFAYRDSGNQDIDVPVSSLMMQSWKEIGLDVQLVDKKLISNNDWIKRITTDDPEVDVFEGAWSLGTSPDPSQFCAETAAFNIVRYIDDNLRKDMADINSDKAFDDKELVKMYHKFDEDYAAAMPHFPTRWSTALTWVNKRVKYASVKPYEPDWFLYMTELTADQPVK